MTVDLFIPCFMDQVYPNTAFNVVKTLRKAGVEVCYNPKQTCCGQPAFNSGYWKDAKKLALKFIRDFPNNRPIIAPSASCAGYVKNYFPELSDDPSFLENYSRLKTNLYEFTDFLVNQLEFTDFGAEFRAKVTYHDACAALREYGIKKEPRILLSKVKGLELIEMENTETCCGFGGTFSIKHEAISTAMAQQKVEFALASGAQFMASTEASCLLHLDAYIKKHDLPIKTIHIADILASGW